MTGTYRWVTGPVRDFASTDRAIRGLRWRWRWRAAVGGGASAPPPAPSELSYPSPQSYEMGAPDCAPGSLDQRHRNELLRRSGPARGTLVRSCNGATRRHSDRGCRHGQLHRHRDERRRVDRFRSLDHRLTDRPQCAHLFPIGDAQRRSTARTAFGPDGDRQRNRSTDRASAARRPRDSILRRVSSPAHHWACRRRLRTSSPHRTPRGLDDR